MRVFLFSFFTNRISHTTHTMHTTLTLTLALTLTLTFTDVPSFPSPFVWFRPRHGNRLGGCPTLSATHGT